jgi:acetate---CoA ligase (ADP-forming)
MFSQCQQPCDIDAVAAAIASLSVLALELGHALDALDVNPLICGPAGVLAVDVLAVTHRRATTLPPPDSRSGLGGSREPGRRCGASAGADD